MRKLELSEKQLIGKWQITNGVPKPDEISERIDYLISKVLVRFSSSEDGWSVLYQDKEDGRYWELTYPESELHGGGPPTLTWLSFEEVKKRYKI